MIERVGHLAVVRLKKSHKRTVSLVENLESGGAVVVKVYESGAEAVREYEVLDACRTDPHVVQPLDFFEVEGRWCLVTEYVQGDTLNGVAERRGPLAPAKVVDIMCDVLEGVSSVHRRGYVHGDLHGDNVIVTDFDAARTKIIDFQHAAKKLRSGKAPAIRRGDRRRMAPECNTGIIDERFDIYSAGYMCGALLTGAIDLEDPVVESRLAGRKALSLWKVVRKAMSQDLEKRYRSADEMIEALLDA